MKYILAIAFVSFGLSAQADWVEEQVIYEVNSKDAMEMTEAFLSFPEATKWLNAHSLTATSRLRVVGLTGSTSLYRWENDANCTVQDPIAVPKIELYSATTDYIYEAEPTVVWQLITSMGAKDPCSGGPRPEVKNRTRRV